MYKEPRVITVVQPSTGFKPCEFMSTANRHSMERNLAEFCVVLLKGKLGLSLLSNNPVGVSA